MGELSTDEIIEITGSVEQKLKQTLGDPDEGIEIRADVRDRLLRQKKAVANRERGEELNEVAKRLGIEEVEDRREGQQANDDIPEDIIHLPERDLNSIAHIPGARLVHREQVKDFEMQVIEDAQSK
ncbi:MAG TPA: hypothetical protein VK582_12865 [Pyrinomonadaceae bacterium]|nr:hypothetical protein [Pyrinomonadaceae bacterium]